MGLADLQCRACGKPYNWPEGCAICEEAKANVVYNAQVETFTAEDVGWETVRVLRDCLSRVRNELNNLPHNKSAATLNTEASKLGRTLTGLIAELRKAEKDTAADIRKMTPGQKAQAFLNYVAELPEDLREEVLSRTVRMLQPAEGIQTE